MIEHIQHQHRPNRSMDSIWTVKNAIRLLVAQKTQPVSAYGLEHEILQRWPNRERQIAGKGKVGAALFELATAGELKRDHKVMPSVFRPTHKLKLPSLTT